MDWLPRRPHFQHVGWCCPEDTSKLAMVNIAHALEDEIDSVGALCAVSHEFAPVASRKRGSGGRFRGHEQLGSNVI